MPQETTWYCGHCGHGPMNSSHDTHCWNCHRLRDGYSREETHYVPSDRRFNTGSSQSSLLGGNSSYGSTVDYPASGTYGRAAHAGFSYNNYGTSGVMSGMESRSGTYRSSPLNEIPKGGYSPLTRGSRRWFCCHCDEGPMLVDTTPRCCKRDCQHIKCGDCPVE